MKMNIIQKKNVVQISNLISDMSRRNATEREIDRAIVYLDGVLNDELEFDDIKSLGGLNDLINKYQPK